MTKKAQKPKCRICGKKLNLIVSSSLCPSCYGRSRQDPAFEAFVARNAKP